MYGTGFFPTERSNIYALEADELYLTGTSEVALAALHMGEILEADELPLRYAGFSTCFRREAGAAGKDTRGMFRVHQFNKVEMFVFVDPEDSWDEHERMVALEEEFLQALGLPYRAVNVAAGDLGAPAAKKIDLEAWFPLAGPLPRGHVVLEHDRLPGAPPRHPLCAASTASSRSHTLNGTMVTDRAVARDPRELPGRRARRAARLRRARPRRALIRLPDAGSHRARCGR